MTAAIPGVGYSLRGFINGGAQYLVTTIGTKAWPPCKDACDSAIERRSQRIQGDNKPLLRPSLFSSSK